LSISFLPGNKERDRRLAAIDGCRTCGENLHDLAMSYRNVRIPLERIEITLAKTTALFSLCNELTGLMKQPADYFIRHRGLRIQCFVDFHHKPAYGSKPRKPGITQQKLQERAWRWDPAVDTFVRATLVFEEDFMKLKKPVAKIDQSLPRRI
jgi:hypothetical protein